MVGPCAAIMSCPIICARAAWPANEDADNVDGLIVLDRDSLTWFCLLTVLGGAFLAAGKLLPPPYVLEISCSSQYDKAVLKY
jgi:hypothetical protein